MHNSKPITLTRKELRSTDITFALLSTLNLTWLVLSCKLYFGFYFSGNPNPSVWYNKWCSVAWTSKRSKQCCHLLVRIGSSVNNDIKCILQEYMVRHFKKNIFIVPVSMYINFPEYYFTKAKPSIQQCIWSLYSNFFSA